MEPTHTPLVGVLDPEIACTKRSTSICFVGVVTQWRARKYLVTLRTGTRLQPRPRFVLVPAQHSFRQAKAHEINQIGVAEAAAILAKGEAEAKVQLRWLARGSIRWLGFSAEPRGGHPCGSSHLRPDRLGVLG